VFLPRGFEFPLYDCFGHFVAVDVRERVSGDLVIDVGRTHVFDYVRSVKQWITRDVRPRVGVEPVGVRMVELVGTLAGLEKEVADDVERQRDTQFVAAVEQPSVKHGLTEPAIAQECFVGFFSVHPPG
jgi:hypothetical protein